MASLFLAIIHYEQDLVHNGTKQTQLESWSGPSTQHNSPGTVSRCCDALLHCYIAQSFYLPMGIFLRPCMCKPTERDFPLPIKRAIRKSLSLSLSLTACINKSTKSSI